jgi:hypothetical protein
MTQEQYRLSYLTIHTHSENSRGRTARLTLAGSASAEQKELTWAELVAERQGHKYPKEKIAATQTSIERSELDQLARRNRRQRNEVRILTTAPCGKCEISCGRHSTARRPAHERTKRKEQNGEWPAAGPKLALRHLSDGDRAPAWGCEQDLPWLENEEEKWPDRRNTAPG